MKKYPKYKDSGIEWVGAIPEGWDYGLMKFQLSNNDGGVWGTDIENEDEGTIVIRSTEITIDGRWDLSNPMRRKLSDSEINKTLLKEGDIVLTKSSGSPDHIGKSVIVDKTVSNLKCCYSNFVQRLRFKDYSPKLYHYILNCYIVREQYRFLTQSTTGLGNLNGTTLNEVLIPFIPLPEQQQIVTYLDQKTTLIDQIISGSEKKIELLQEKRTATINHAVTKGLNPKVKMKDSGVEWIGEIPEGWIVSKNKFFLIPIDNRSVDGQEELLSVSEHRGVVPRKSIKNDEEVLSRAETLEGYKKVSWGQLVSNIMLTWKRGLGVSSYEGIVSPAYSVFEFVESHPKYFHYLFRTDQYIAEFKRNSTGVIESRLRMYDDTFLRLKSHIPPLPEQQQIVTYLDQRTKEIDDLIASEKKRIELLKEYRQSLISEVVTGKIKVTNE
jgi:type I restriction enzyme S subunit